jgi:hypothetical protein
MQTVGHVLPILAINIVKIINWQSICSYWKFEQKPNRKICFRCNIGQLVKQEQEGIQEQKLAF